MPRRWACSPTRCSWRPTSCSTTPSSCPSATTSASTSSSPATSRVASTARYGETFVVPEALILKESARIYDLQNPTSEDVEVGRVASRRLVDARRARGDGEEDHARRHRHRRRRALRPGEQAGHLEPARHLSRAITGAYDRRPRGRVRRPRLRRLQEGRRRRGRRPTFGADPRSARSSCSTTRPSSTACSPVDADRADASGPTRRWRRCTTASASPAGRTRATGDAPHERGSRSTSPASPTPSS